MLSYSVDDYHLLKQPTNENANQMPARCQHDGTHGVYELRTCDHAVEPDIAISTVVCVTRFAVWRDRAEVVQVQQLRGLIVWGVSHA